MVSLSFFASFSKVVFLLATTYLMERGFLPWAARMETGRKVLMDSKNSLSKLANFALSFCDAAPENISVAFIVNYGNTHFRCLPGSGSNAGVTF